VKLGFVLVNSKRFHAIPKLILKHSLMFFHEILLEADFISACEILNGFLEEELMVHIIFTLGKGCEKCRFACVKGGTADVVEVLAGEEV